eukprot:4109852-Amphidinium_carterae.1
MNFSRKAVASKLKDLEEHMRKESQRLTQEAKDHANVVVGIERQARQGDNARIAKRVVQVVREVAGCMSNELSSLADQVDAVEARQGWASVEVPELNFTSAQQAPSSSPSSSARLLPFSSRPSEASKVFRSKTRHNSRNSMGPARDKASGRSSTGTQRSPSVSAACSTYFTQPSHGSVAARMVKRVAVIVLCARQAGRHRNLFFGKFALTLPSSTFSSPWLAGNLCVLYGALGRSVRSEDFSSVP